MHVNKVVMWCNNIKLVLLLYLGCSVGSSFRIFIIIVAVVHDVLDRLVVMHDNCCPYQLVALQLSDISVSGECPILPVAETR